MGVSWDFRTLPTAPEDCSAEAVLLRPRRRPLLLRVLPLQRMPPLQQSGIGRHQRGFMGDGGCGNDSVRRIVVETLEFSRRNCDVAGDGQFTMPAASIFDRCSPGALTERTRRLVRSIANSQKLIALTARLS